MRVRGGLIGLSALLIGGSASAWPFPAGSQLPPWPSALPPITWLPPPPALPSIATPPIALGPITRGPDYVLAAKTTPPKTTPFVSAVPHVKFAPDGKTLLMHAKITRIGSETNAYGVALGTVHAYRSSWSPDSKHVVLSEESRALTVWTAAGKLVHKIDNAFGSGKYNGLEVGFPESTTAYFHDGCRLNKLDIASGVASPVGITSQCGRIYVSKDGKRWIVLEEGSKSYGVGLWYVRATAIDLVSGAPRVILDSSKLPSWTDVQISPVGDRLCLTKMDGKAACVVVDTGVLEDATDAQVDRLFVFSADGSKLLWADRGSPLKGLHVTDFTARTMRKIASISSNNRAWHFMSGDTRVVAQGYDGATAFDLAKGWTLPIFVGGESESFFAYPGNPKRAFIGKASGPSTDLFKLELPD
jgi:hypothetical protein